MREQVQDSVMCVIVVTPDKDLGRSRNNEKEQCLEIKYVSVAITSEDARVREELGILPISG